MLIKKDRVFKTLKGGWYRYRNMARIDVSRLIRKIPVIFILIYFEFVVYDWVFIVFIAIDWRICLGFVWDIMLVPNLCESSRVITNGPFYNYLIVFKNQRLQWSSVIWYPKLTMLDASSPISNLDFNRICIPIFKL